jgi:hypothetical protein
LHTDDDDDDPMNSSCHRKILGMPNSQLGIHIRLLAPTIELPLSTKTLIQLNLPGDTEFALG